MENNIYDRQILAFGRLGQQKIENTHVGIVGLGGIGSQVVQGLAYLGVSSFVLVDEDFVDDSNLNRLVGATQGDALRKTSKTVIAEKMIRAIRPEAKIKAIKENLRSMVALTTLIECPVIFGCVDHDGPRLILMELSAAFEAMYIDAAVEIFAEDGVTNDFGGRVIVCNPGEYCLDCANQIDMETAKWELLSPVAREISRAHGYGVEENGHAPAVISLNGIIANLALTEFLVATTGIRKPNLHMTYYGMRGNVNIRSDGRRKDCFTCGYLAGSREKANIYRYSLDNFKKED